VNPTHPAHPDLDALVHIFYRRMHDLGRFTEVAPTDLPAPYDILLAHHSHMTVTLERYFDCRVNLQVLETHTTESHYSRKILLLRPSDEEALQFGIARLDFSFLDAEVRCEIESQAAPLGRILIEHNVLRQVQLASLWRVEPSAELRKLFGLEKQGVTYGRTALIYCNGDPAVELLEIVRPM